MKVKVHYLFSKNKKIGSRIISWGSRQLTKRKNVPSHIAILVNERWVFESTLESGVRVISYVKWKEINEEVAKIPCTNIYREYSEIKYIFKEIKGKKYDWYGVSYLGLCLVPNKLFKTSLPKENKWEKKDRYFCCEAVEKLANLSNSSMKTPVQLLDEMYGTT